MSTINEQEFGRFCDEYIDGTDNINREWLFNFCRAYLDAKQREAEPVGEVTGDGFPMLYGHKPLQPKTKLYTHPQQRNAVEVTDEMVDAACYAFDDVYEATIDIGDTYYRDNKRVAIRAALSAVASRDREDAERYRWLRDKSQPELCTFYLSVHLSLENIRFEPKTVDEAIDAARRENKP